VTDEDELLEGELIMPQEAVPIDDPRDIRQTGFDQLTTAERQEMSRRGVVARRLKRQARQLANLQAYTEAHRDLASQILGTKMVLLDGLIEEMANPVTGQLDTTKLDEKRMKLLMTLMEQLEKRAFGGTVQKSEVSQTVDIKAAIVDLTKALQRPDSV
jgi:hypothetical protein